ncbi:Ferrous iron transport protein B [Methanococcoides methylutens MM1]|uniref:Ferrous iron transport protein B n=2 Tax=Methanococcoides methylutens TaxID=2226 RepID=A0A0E3WYR3_METMT|nr:ferrous iron transport protein B [Methanococcoides methylutens]AKB84155.1 Ferrous iron transport protein B [Methanococcoides methylutens MM1]
MTIAFVGNPSVGKSAFFSRLTGIGVVVANYPGTTVELTHGSINVDSKKIDVVDLPGIYSLGASTEDEKVSKRYLLREYPDVIINVVDATRLERNLYLTLQLLELDIPMVVALNQMDAAKEMGLELDIDKLSDFLGVPVIPTVATKGLGLDEVVLSALGEELSTENRRKVHYDNHILRAIGRLDEDFPEISYGIKVRALERDEEFVKLSCRPHDADLLLATSESITEEIEKAHEMQISDTIARDLYGEAGYIVDRVTTQVERKATLKDKIDSLLTSEYVGIAGLVSALLITFFIVFSLGGFLEEGIVSLFETYLIFPVEGMLADSSPIFRNVVIYSLLGIEAGFAIAIPYIAVFYVILSLFEDSGYLTRASFLLDNWTHKVGLHGRAIIPLVLGLGCNVPAIMSTRALNTLRERRIASILIALTPCSARTVIILGLVGTFVGYWAAISIYVLELVVIFGTGWVLGKGLPGEKTGLIMEMAPLRRPDRKATLQKTWLRVREFVYVAFPLLVAGSALLGLLDAVGVLDVFENAVEPVSVGLFGLPAFAATALIFGILRKEMALQILAVLAGTANFAQVLTPIQMYSFAVITTIYVPCVATIAILKHELGWKDTALISMFTICLALLAGFLINVAGMML